MLVRCWTTEYTHPPSTLVKIVGEAYGNEDNGRGTRPIIKRMTISAWPEAEDAKGIALELGIDGLLLLLF